MSDPQPLPGSKKPARAEPLRPDVPGSGTKTDSKANADTDSEADTAAGDEAPHTGDAAAAGDVPHGPGGADKIKQQSADALANVREGYD